MVGAKKKLNVVRKFGLRKDRSKKEKFKKPRKNLICPYPKCQAVVKRIHNHLVEVHKATHGSEKYKRVLAETTEHNPIVISSNSDDSSNYDGSLSKVQQKVKRKRSVIQSVFKRVYPSDEEKTSTFGMKKKKKENAKEHPSIFQKETDDENDDESVFERTYANDEEETSTFRKNKKKKENAKKHPSIFRKETDDENYDESVFERAYANDEEETSTFRKNKKKKENAKKHPSIFRKETDDENDDESVFERAYASDEEEPVPFVKIKRRKKMLRNIHLYSGKRLMMKAYSNAHMQVMKKKPVPFVKIKRRKNMLKNIHLYSGKRLTMKTMTKVIAMVNIMAKAMTTVNIMMKAMAISMIKIFNILQFKCRNRICRHIRT